MGAGLQLPVSVQTRFCRFSIEAYEPGPDQLMFFRLQMSGWNSYANLHATPEELLAFADLIYRTCGKQPRDVEQVVRVELVAAAPPIEALTRFGKTEEPTDDEVAAIRRRMMEGR